jgi:hypothetical protein
MSIKYEINGLGGHDVSVLQTFEEMGYDLQKIITKLAQIKSQRNRAAPKKELQNVGISRGSV